MTRKRSVARSDDELIEQILAEVMDGEAPDYLMRYCLRMLISEMLAELPPKSKVLPLSLPRTKAAFSAYAAMLSSFDRSGQPRRAVSSRVEWSIPMIDLSLPSCFTLQ